MVTGMAPRPLFDEDLEHFMDYQQLTDNIRSFLASSDQTRSEELEGGAHEYVNWCKQTNERLRRCQQCLQKGRRAEAIHFAEEEPQLLDIAPVLAFPELPEWRETCVRYSLPEPPQLLMEIAKSINEAYAENEPAVQLLARHRIMGLARAPLNEHGRLLGKLSPYQALVTGSMWGTKSWMAAMANR